MNPPDFADLCETILDVIEPKLSQAGLGRKAIESDMNLMEILDSFGVLDMIIEVEERAAVSVDLGAMDFDSTMTVENLANEIIRIHSNE